MDKLGVTQGLKQWMGRHKLELKVANGEECIDSPHQFDRIIANLVLMAT